METEKLTTESEQILFQFSLYNRRQHGKTRRSVHNAEESTPTHIQYIFRHMSYNIQFWAELLCSCSSCALYRLLRRP